MNKTIFPKDYNETVRVLTSTDFEDTVKIIGLYLLVNFSILLNKAKLYAIYNATRLRINKAHFM